MVLNKTDKKTDKDIMGVKKILQKVNFDAVIGRGADERIGEEEIQELAQYMKYQFVSPGNTITEEGSEADTFYIILKGKVQMQIPDQSLLDKSDSQLVSHEQVKSENENIEENQHKLSLNLDEIGHLSQQEQERYKTRNELFQILKSTMNTKRLTRSPRDVLNKQLNPYLESQTLNESPLMKIIKKKAMLQGNVAVKNKQTQI